MTYTNVLFSRFCNWVNEDHGETGVTGDDAAFGRWLDGDTASIDFQRILSIIGRMEYKRRQTCPGTKVSRVAFGIGRRIPIVEKWS